MHVVGLTSILDVPRLVVVSSSDGSRLLVEVPDLLSSSIVNLNGHVSVVEDFEESVVWELGDDVEVSFDVESEFLVVLSLSWFSLPFVSVDDIPLLVDLAVLGSDDDVSVLRVIGSLNFDNLSSFVDNECILVSEELPPS